MTTLHQTRKAPHEKTIGIEIECLVLNPVARGCHDGFFFAGTDGSIMRYGEEGTPVEFVSQPLTPEWLKKEIYKLHRKYGISHNRSCGIHVHVSKGWCSTKRGLKIAKFLTMLRPEDMEYVFGRRPNDYCENTVARDAKYVAVNVSKTETVEFRSFCSGSAQWACYCVDLVCYLVRNHSTLNVDALMAFRDLYPKEM